MHEVRYAPSRAYIAARTLDENTCGWNSVAYTLHPVRAHARETVATPFVTPDIPQGEKAPWAATTKSPAEAMP